MRFASILLVSSILFVPSIFADVKNSDEGVESDLYEDKFLTRIDHSKPTNQNLTEFVSFLIFLSFRRRKCFFCVKSEALIHITQVYNANTEYYRANGPVYIYIKDINYGSTQWIRKGLMVDIARSTGALLLTFDMRFFGKNRPTRFKVQIMLGTQSDN